MTTLKMPAEWTPHRRSWMAWPNNPEILGADPAPAYHAWADVANAIVAFEPVTMIVPPGETETARRHLFPEVETLEHPLGDSWVRDSGPTFAIDDRGRLAAIDWQFNGWGGRTFPERAADAGVARFVAQASGASRIPSKLVNEGGAIHVDGEGTLIVTESVLLNPNRNPSWLRIEVEAELKTLLGVTKIIWLKRGLVADSGPFGTDGHVDTLAAFVRPGVVVAHGQSDPQHPDYQTCRENLDILRNARDAKGKRLEVVVLDAPREKYDQDGLPLSLSYVNFYFVNGGVVIGTFDDPMDDKIADVFRRLFPDRRVIGVPATEIFLFGGGIHCITQQQPATRFDDAPPEASR